MSLTESRVPGSSTVYDGFSTVTRGMDSGRAPSLIGKDQVAFLINSTTRSGYPQNRPGWSRVPLAGDVFDMTRPLFQGASPYYAPNGAPFIIASIGGKIYRLDPIRGTILNLSAVSGQENPSNLPKAWFCQAQEFLAMQDNSSVPLVLNGSSLVRNIPIDLGGNGFPIGNAMEYNNGRLWVALQDRRTFSGGDLAYSVTGTSADVLTSTQNKFLTNGAFVLPSTAGLITAMRSIAVQDSVLGQGPLIVFGQFGAGTVNAPFAADQWQNTASPIETVGLMSAGPVSQEATIQVNGDIWYRSPDGIRSYMVARRDHGTFVNTPVSHEMERVLNRDDQFLLDHCSAVDFDNRRLETASPVRMVNNSIMYGVGWRGLSVLDFSPVTSMFDRTSPAWEGIWNGLTILQILTLKCFGVDRCFMFALNDTFEFELWELSRDSKFDNTMQPIEWTIETRSLGFADNGETLKRFERPETWFTNLAGGLSYTIQYRPDDYQGWLDLDSGVFGAQMGLCSVGCTPPVGPIEQYRPRKIAEEPDENECEECVSKKFRNGFEFQFRLTMTGAARLKRFRVAATEVPEDVAGGCLGSELTE